MIEMAALLRLIPYLMAVIIAARKGYRWISAAILWVMIIAILNFTFKLDAEIRAGLASVSAILLLIHVLSLGPRR